MYGQRVIRDTPRHVTQTDWAEVFRHIDLTISNYLQDEHGANTIQGPLLLDKHSRSLGDSSKNLYTEKALSKNLLASLVAAAKVLWP